MKWLDDFFENRTRAVAQHTSRRSALLKIGRVLVGSAFILPVLPFDRSPRAQHGAVDDGKHDPLDPISAASTGATVRSTVTLCTCCGGSDYELPAGNGSVLSDLDRNLRKPGRRQTLSCQLQRLLRRQPPAAAVFVTKTKANDPAYRMGVHNDINWCMGNESSIYHCTVSIILGVSGKAG